MRPSLHSVRPAISSSNVDLPQPDGPTTEKNSPRANARSIGPTACKVEPAAVTKRFVTPCSATCGSMAGCDTTGFSRWKGRGKFTRAVVDVSKHGIPIGGKQRCGSPTDMRPEAWARLLLIGALVLLLELLCRAGIIDQLTMPPPTVILRDLVVLLASGTMNAAMLKTVSNVVLA